MRRLFSATAFLLLLGFASASPSAQPTEVVRVRLMAETPLSEAVVTAFDVPLAVSVDGRAVGHLAVGDRLQVRRGDRVQVSGPGIEAAGREIVLSGGPVRVTAGGVDRSYAGSLHATVAYRRLVLVNHAPMVDYVASVVASEYPFTEIEGVKAQAVLARTYALRRRGASPTHDVDDHQGSQVYRGMGAVTPTSRRAAQETAGEVILYRGALAEAVYSSSSGGHTADNETAWDGAPLPYLRGVPDPYDAGAPDHEWQTMASAAAVHRALSDQFGGHVSGVSIDQRSPEGRVLRVRLEGGRRGAITGPQFRAAVNAALGHRTVRSTRFTLSLRGGEYVFDGGGYGHGVGMSQYGARGQAQAGRSYREILTYYFQGTEVALAPGALGPALVAAAGRPAVDSPPIVRGSTEARRWPTPRRLVGLASEASPPAEPQGAEPQPRRRAW